MVMIRLLLPPRLGPSQRPKAGTCGLIRIDRRITRSQTDRRAATGGGGGRRVDCAGLLERR